MKREDREEKHEEDCMDCIKAVHNLDAWGCEVHLIEPTLYTIPQLEWKISENGTHYAEGIDGKMFFVDKSEGKYYWYYGFRESCTSIEDGKKQAQEHYEAQLIESLEVYRG